MQHFKRLAIVLDILINVLLGGRVETMSSRMGRNLQTGRRCLVCTAVCWLLSRWWPNHCTNNIMTPVDKP